MTINKVRSGLYTGGKVLGDVNAVQKGKILQRIARRLAGKLIGRGLGRIFK